MTSTVPLKCSCCGSEMRPHKPVRNPVRNPDQIRRQLERLGLWEPINLTKAPDHWAQDNEPIFWMN